MEYTIRGFVRTPGIDPAFWTFTEASGEFNTLKEAETWGQTHFDEFVGVEPAKKEQEDEKPF